MIDILGFLAIIISLWVFHKENSKEMKEFHGRLCTLEEKYINIMERHNKEMETIWRELGKNK